MSDYLTDEEQLARLKSWWDDNGVMLMVALAVGIGGIVGYRWYDDNRQEEIARRSDLYAEYIKAPSAERESVLERISTELKDSSYYTLALLSEAQQNVENELYETAEVELQTALSSASGVLADLTRLRLARVLQQLDRTDEALATLAGD